MDQQKTCLGYVLPKLQRWQMSSMHSYINSTVNQYRAHSHIWIHPKITNYTELEVSTSKNIRDVNMNPPQIVETIQNSSELVSKELEEKIVHDHSIVT